jgi:hypothetical protein
VIRLLFISALSGCVWALIAHLLTGSMAGIEGAMAASPVIGVLVALAFRKVERRTVLKRAMVALTGLYLAVALFGLAMGITDVLRGPRRGPGWQRKPVETVAQAVIGCMWGVTWAGWVVFLAPLAYVNFMLVEPRSRGARAQEPTSSEVT